MPKEIISDQSGEIVKKLSKPVKTTVLDGRTRIPDEDDDVSSLNAGTGGSEKKGLDKAREAEVPKRNSNKMLVGNEGMDANGKIDWSKNPDCLDYIFQQHEGLGNPNTTKGFFSTATKCVRAFNKMFGKKGNDGKFVDAKVTAEEIAEQLHANVDKLGSDQSDGIDVDTSEGKEDAAREAVNDAVKKTLAPKKVEFYYPLERTALEFKENKYPLNGTKFEICKILNCPNICMMKRKDGDINQNGWFHAGCGASEGGSINKDLCPQEKSLSEKEAIAFQMLLSQFNGDELAAKKFLYLSRTLYK